MQINHYLIASKNRNFSLSTLAFPIFFYFCAMKNNFIIAFMLALLVLTGCTGKGNRSGSSQPSDTLYTEKAAMKFTAHSQNVPCGLSIRRCCWVT